MNTELSKRNFQITDVFSNCIVYLVTSFQSNFSDILFISVTSSNDWGKTWLDLTPHTSGRELSHGRCSGINLTQTHDR